MTSAELRELTASEPLTLDEEYEMQRECGDFLSKLPNPAPRAPAAANARSPVGAATRNGHSVVRQVAVGRRQCVSLAYLGDVRRSSPHGATPELTFIVLDGTPLASAEGTTISPESLRGLPMIGDVNLFLKGTPDEEEFEVEAEIMVAGARFRACIFDVH